MRDSLVPDILPLQEIILFILLEDKEGSVTVATANDHVEGRYEPISGFSNNICPITQEGFQGTGLTIDSRIVGHRTIRLIELRIGSRSKEEGNSGGITVLSGITERSASGMVKSVGIRVVSRQNH